MPTEQEEENARCSAKEVMSALARNSTLNTTRHGRSRGGHSNFTVKPDDLKEGRNGMSSTISNKAKLAAIAAAAVLAFTALGPGEARAQAFNVVKFDCTADPFGVIVDVRGLGNTDVCVEGSVSVDLNCACVGGGGNCPRDAKKQITAVTSETAEVLEPKNGRVTGTVTLTSFAPTDALCTTGETALTCPSGQTPKLIEFVTEGAEFTLCTDFTITPDGCSCDPGSRILDSTTCGPTSDVVFSGKRNSCIDLFR
jgi:hypothetical protein